MKIFTATALILISWLGCSLSVHSSPSGYWCPPEEKAHDFAKKHPEVLSYIFPYCDAGREDELGHRSLLDCFRGPNPTCDSSDCWLITARVAKLYQRKYPIKMIQKIIDENYSFRIQNSQSKAYKNYIENCKIYSTSTQVPYEETHALILTR